MRSNFSVTIIALLFLTVTNLVMARSVEECRAQNGCGILDSCSFNCLFNPNGYKSDAVIKKEQEERLAREERERQAKKASDAVKEHFKQ
jgi:hypothetical protein